MSRPYLSTNREESPPPYTYFGPDNYPQIGAFTIASSLRSYDHRYQSQDEREGDLVDLLTMSSEDTHLNRPRRGRTLIPGANQTTQPRSISEGGKASEYNLRNRSVPRALPKDHRRSHPVTNPPKNTGVFRTQNTSLITRTGHLVHVYSDSGNRDTVGSQVISDRIHLRSPRTSYYHQDQTSERNDFQVTQTHQLPNSSNQEEQGTMPIHETDRLMERSNTRPNTPDVDEGQQLIRSEGLATILNHHLNKFGGFLISIQSKIVIILITSHLVAAGTLYMNTNRQWWCERLTGPVYLGGAIAGLIASLILFIIQVR